MLRTLALPILLSLICGAAFADSGEVVGNEGIVLVTSESALREVLTQSPGLIAVKVDAAICDRGLTDCDLQALTSFGRQPRFLVRAKDHSIVYVSASGAKTQIPVVNGHDVSLLLRLAGALEKYGEDCKALLFLNPENAKVQFVGTDLQCVY